LNKPARLGTATGLARGNLKFKLGFPTTGNLLRLNFYSFMVVILGKGLLSAYPMGICEFYVSFL
jgi:hypothetical protein